MGRRRFLAAWWIPDAKILDRIAGTFDSVTMRDHEFVIVIVIALQFAFAFLNEYDIDTQLEGPKATKYSEKRDNV